jgi:hypothetical protein
MAQGRLKMKKRAKIAVICATFLLGIVSFASDADAQNKRKKTVSARPAATPTPTRTDPEVISRADQFLDENGNVVTPEGPPVVDTTETGGVVRTGSSVDDLDQRIRFLEGDRKRDSDEKQRRLALNLEILTKAEQRVESLRKQYFDMIEKEGKVQERLDTIDLDIRPDSIERNVAFAGSLRPEVLREARQKTLAAERTKLQTLLAEVQRNKANLDLNIQRADSLVERLRIKLEKEIDEALGDDEEKPVNP